MGVVVGLNVVKYYLEIPFVYHNYVVSYPLCLDGHFRVVIGSDELDTNNWNSYTYYNYAFLIEL